MRSMWFRSRGLFTGSGVVAADCQAVISQCLKQSGMRWTVNGASAIATLRRHQASCPDGQIWQQARYQTGTALPESIEASATPPVGYLQN
jgi:hypothetical protein